MGAVDIIPIHAVRNTDGTLCAYFVLEFIRMLIVFGTDLENLDRNYIRRNVRSMDTDVMEDLYQWL